MPAPVSTVSLLIGATLAISLGYIAVGIYIIRAHTGRSVKTLGNFAVLWGVGNGLTNSMDLYLSTGLGIVTQSQFSVAAFPRWLEVTLTLGTFVSILLLTVSPFVWTAFVLNYTTELRSRHRLLYAGAVAVVTLFVILFTAPSLLGVLGIQIGFADGFLFLTGLIIVGSQIGVAGAGVAQLYTSSQRHDVFGLIEVLAVAAPLLLLFNNAANNFGLYSQSFRLYSVYLFLHIAGIGGLVAAVTRYDLFEQLPAATKIGRDTAMASVDLGIMMLDEHDRVMEINETAKTMFDTTESAAVGAKYRTVHPSLTDIDLSVEQRQTIQVQETSRVFEADNTAVADRYDRPLGTAVTFYDVTNRKRRRERIQVLNRVLRHNLRNELTGARGYAQLLADEPQNAAELGERITTHHDQLISLSEKAQRIERLLDLDRMTAGATPLSEIVDDSIAAVNSASSASLDPERLTTSVPESYSLRTNSAILRMVLVELLENAIEHGDTPEVDISFDESGHTLVITDTGPGIPDIEIEVLKTETETQTKHGQGLGLWLIKWGIDRLGGSIDIDADSSGTRIKIELPTAHLVSSSKK